jgi:hypothetical protein
MLALFKLSLDLIQLPSKLRYMYINFEISNFATDFEKLHNVGSIPLDGFNSHVVVHSLLHKRSFSKVFGIIGNHLCVQSIEPG